VYAGDLIPYNNKRFGTFFARVKLKKIPEKDILAYVI
jgi:hypothetical protein